MGQISKEVKVLPGITITYGKGGISTSFHFDDEEAVLYCKVHFQSDTGLQEKYSFSNTETTKLFIKAFVEYSEVLKTAKKLLSQFANAPLKPSKYYIERANKTYIIFKLT